MQFFVAAKKTICAGFHASCAAAAAELFATLDPDSEVVYASCGHQESPRPIAGSASPVQYRNRLFAASLGKGDSTCSLPVSKKVLAISFPSWFSVGMRLGFGRWACRARTRGGMRKEGHGLRVHAPWAPGSEADVRPGRNCEFPVRVEARPRTVDFVAMSEGRLVNDRRV